jgi:hypothetical protein
MVSEYLAGARAASMNTDNVYYCMRTETVETTILSVESGRAPPFTLANPVWQESSTTPARTPTKPVMRPRPKPRMPPPVPTQPSSPLLINKVEHYKSTVLKSIVRGTVTPAPKGVDDPHYQKPTPASTSRSNNTVPEVKTQKATVNANERESTEAPATASGNVRRPTSTVMYRMSAPDAGRLASCLRKLDLVSESAGSAICRMSQCVCSVIAALRGSHQTTHVDKEAVSRWKCNCKARAMVRIYDYERTKTPSVKYEIEVMLSSDNEATLCVRTKASGLRTSATRGSPPEPEPSPANPNPTDAEQREEGERGQVALQKRAALPWEVAAHKIPSPTLAATSLVQQPVAEGSLVRPHRKALGQLTFI